MTTFRTKIPNHFDLPRRITRLGELAYNLWWTWNPDAQRLFSRIDNALWERLNHNPLLFMRQVGRSEINAASQKTHYLEQYDRVMQTFDVYLGASTNWVNREYPQKDDQCIAYFSMEFGLHETLPIYSGGLGVLAGDVLKGSSDLGLNLVGMGLLYAEGYFSQHITEDGWQEAQNQPIKVSDLPILPVLKDDGQPLTISISYPEHNVTARMWEIRVGRLPLYLLDSDLPVNDPDDRKLTARLYLSNLDLRIKQELLLGVGGVRALRTLGFDPQVWHMNEGHAAFLTLERIRERVAAGVSFDEARRMTCPSNVFTTHTPVPAGNDEFPAWLVDKYLASMWPDLGLTRQQFIDLANHHQSFGDTFSMPTLALKFSDHRNAVSELHGRVARHMWKDLWPGLEEDEVPITHVTNGVHTPTWLARRLRNLYDHHLGAGWLERVDDPQTWTGISNISIPELWEVHQHLKRKLAFYLLSRARQGWMDGDLHPVQVLAAGALLDPYVLTIGFARRFATYKRANLIFNNLPRLLSLLNSPNRPVQIIFAGKAHPADEPGTQLIQEVYRTIKRADNGGRLVFLEDYDINLARYLVQGVDVWLNTPRRPNEACGTSGMKAAINGVLNLSVLDGWWREAYNGNNGWVVGDDGDSLSESQDQADAASLYHTLENEIIPLYYGERGGDNIPHKWVGKMQESINTITPQFGVQRMLKEYISRLYFSQ